ncbi:response regulator transcription factor [Ferrimonas aestuarii]|uniref:Response regulator transcription factor n=2 Tax=Ferrimonas aestuarii TaxID=2569539 RepID=A0A4U1BRQ7_9GAMM|nr:response regulator transcription factor [Ferrimonas aestuarii]
MATTVAEFLDLEGIDVDFARDGVQAWELSQQNQYQVVILDINLPRLDGFSVCQRIRASGDDTPIIMLTAKDRLQDKLQGFEAGADDYLVKPFALDELVARIKALSGRLSRQVRKLTVADLEFNLDENRVSRQGRSLSLPPVSLKLLEVLMRASPKAVAKQQLIESVWGDEVEGSNLKVHIHKLRKVVDSQGLPPLIHTAKALGYVIRESNADSN